MTTNTNTSNKPSKVVFGIITVSHDNVESLNKLLKSLSGEISSDDYVVLVDNHKDELSSKLASSFKCVDKVLRTKNNGFAAACNQAFEHLPSKCTHVLLLNPDTVPEKHSIYTLRSKASNWSACMGLLTMGNNKVNSAGNAVHISGLSWCNGFDDSVKNYTHSEEIFIATGAGVAIERKVWLKIGGMYEDYFLYYEDTDLSTQIVLGGGTIGLEPLAKIFHDYDYGKSDTKWFYLERNRYIYILRCWPLSVIILLLPYLLCIEVGLWIVSIFERRFVLKLHSTVSFVKALPCTIRSRRDVQKNKVISSYRFLTLLEPQVLTHQLGSPNKFKILNAFSKMYYLFVKNILKLTAKKVQ